MKNGRAMGVVLDERRRNLCRRSFPRASIRGSRSSKFMDTAQLAADFLEEVRRYKYRGSSGKVNLALDALPDFKCMPGPGAHLRGAISISPSVEYMERAYDDAKYGNVFAPSVHRHGDSVADRSLRRAAGQARDVVLRAVRAVQAEARPELGRRNAKLSATP